MQMSDSVLISVIGGTATLIASLITAGLSIFNTMMLRNQVSTIHDLEKNTNSMKDALVALTDKEAHARGVKEETERKK